MEASSSFLFFFATSGYGVCRLICVGLLTTTAHAVDGSLQLMITTRFRIGNKQTAAARGLFKTSPQSDCYQFLAAAAAETTKNHLTQSLAGLSGRDERTMA